MSEKLTVRVYRRLDNRIQGLGDDSALAWELHNRRRDALLDALESDDAWDVTSWGKTKDSKETHEFVEPVLLIKVAGPHIASVVIPTLASLGTLLLQEGIKTAVSEAVKHLIQKLVKKMKTNEILDFSVTLPNGRLIKVSPDAEGKAYELTLDGRDIGKISA